MDTNCCPNTILSDFTRCTDVDEQKRVNKKCLDAKQYLFNTTGPSARIRTRCGYGHGVKPSLTERLIFYKSRVCIYTRVEGCQYASAIAPGMDFIVIEIEAQLA